LFLTQATPPVSSGPDGGRDSPRTPGVGAAVGFGFGLLLFAQAQILLNEFEMSVRTLKRNIDFMETRCRPVGAEQNR
jgi:hypothetical protein